MQICSEEAHVHHLAPAFVVSIGGVGILAVVRRSDVQFGVVGVKSVEFKASLVVRNVLPMDLESEGPKVSFPNLTCLRVFDSPVVFIINANRCSREVRASNVVPE